MSPLWSLLALLLVAAGLFLLTLWLQRRTVHRGLAGLIAGVVLLASAALTWSFVDSRLVPTLNALAGVSLLIVYREIRRAERARVAGASKA